VWFRHAKAGEQSEWTDRVTVVSRDPADNTTHVIADWPTYRGEGKSFV
jgi:hypothetical protein